MPFDFNALTDELNNDPLQLGYARMSDAAVAEKINEVPISPEAGRQVDREVIDAWEIFEAIPLAALRAMPVADREILNAILSMGRVNIRRSNTRAVLAGLFSSGDARSNLVSLQNAPASRAHVLGLGRVQVGHIMVANRKP